MYFQILLLISFFENGKKIKKEESFNVSFFPTVTIAVPCWNEGKTLAGTLDSLLSLDYPKDKLEILIGDNNSKDDTLAIAEDLKEKLTQKDIYSTNKTKQEYLLFSLNNFNNKEIIDRENISIEHIIPQNPINWKSFLKEELGEEWQTFHEKYLHTIGNLTLTGYNSEMRNRSFLEKRDMPNGFRESSIKLNQFLVNLEKFGKKELAERADILIDKVIQIWSYPENNFELKYNKSKENQEFSFNLSDEDIDIAGKKPKKITLKINEIDSETEVESWKDCLRFILTKINENCDAEKFNNMVNTFFAYNIKNSNRLAYIADFEKLATIKIANLYIISNYSANEIIKRMAKYCEYFNINLDDVIIFCQ
jgi:glycosyltransferase involved in cell wall biosynthesis